MFQKVKKTHVALKIMGLLLAGPAIAATPLTAKTATLQCAGGRIDLRADCFVYVGRMLACTRQTLSFAGMDGKALGSRVFQAKPIEEGDDYPIIEEKVGAISCVETKDKQDLVAVSMFNGGNCAQCEWMDVYAMDGKLLGTTRERKGRSAALSAALEAVGDKQTKRVLSQTQLPGFYQATATK